MKNYVFIYKTSIDTWSRFQKLKKHLSQELPTVSNLSIDLEDEDAVLRIESSERNEEYILILLHTQGYDGSIMGIFERPQNEPCKHLKPPHINKDITP